MMRNKSTFQSWIITLSILFFSISAVVIALICIFALPDRTVRPFEGALFFWGGGALLTALILFSWKKEKIETGDHQLLVNENISDKIIKWLVTLFSFGFAFWGFAVALICIYALPDGTSQPKTGIAYFFGSAIVIASFIFVVRKNWMNKKP